MMVGKQVKKFDGARIPLWRRLFLRVFRVQVEFTDQSDLIRSKACIVICNHQSLIDGILFAMAAPASMDYAVTPRYAVESAIARRGLAFLVWCGLGRVVPLSASHAHSLRSLRASLVRGRSVMIFPTGTISPADEKKGYLWLSERTGCPVVRASIKGADRSRLFANSGHEWWPRIELSI